MDEDKQATLYIFSGLPGVGKSTLAQLLAARVQAAYLRIDTVEQGLRDLCGVFVQGEGYRLSYRLAGDNLRLGISVVADSVNPIILTRNEWNQVAIGAGCTFVNIEVLCSCKDEHRARVENRTSPVKNLILPQWEDVENREYDLWTKEIIGIDTFGKSEDESFEELLQKLEAL